MRTEYQPPLDIQRQIDEIEADRGRAAEHERAGRIVDDQISAQPDRPTASASRIEDFVMVPRYDVYVSAGNGSVIHSEQVVDYLAFRADWVRNALGVAKKDLVLISVKGDSMEPTLSNGDLILIDTGARRIEDSAIYVLKNHDGLLVKRLQHKLDGSVVVKSDNTRYDAEMYDVEAAKTIIVVGRVVWAGRRL